MTRGSRGGNRVQTLRRSDNWGQTTFFAPPIAPIVQSRGLSPDYRHAKKRFLWNLSALRRLPPNDSRNMHGDEEVARTDLSDLVEVDQRAGIGDSLYPLSAHSRSSCSKSETDHDFRQFVGCRSALRSGSDRRVGRDSLSFRRLVSYDFSRIGGTLQACHRHLGAYLALLTVASGRNSLIGASGRAMKPWCR